MLCPFIFTCLHLSAEWMIEVLLTNVGFSGIYRQWTSFMAGASTAGYVYIYSFYYFFFKTKYEPVFLQLMTGRTGLFMLRFFVWAFSYSLTHFKSSNHCAKCTNYWFYLVKFLHNFIWVCSAFNHEIFLYRMYGLFQTAFYFGYMALFSLALGIMCGKLLITEATQKHFRGTQLLD